MPDKIMEVVDGPDKPALLWAVSYPDRQEVQFKLAEGAITARIRRMSEQADGMSFELEGEVSAGPDEGRPLRGNYSVADRKGALRIVGATPA